MDTLDTIIADLKRSTQYGNPSAPADQSALDILTKINDRISDIVMDWDWEWLNKPITIALQPGVKDYTLDLDVFNLLGLDAGEGIPFNIISFKDYFQYYAPTATQPEAGFPYWGMYIDPAATGARRIRIGNSPTTSSTINGFAEKRVTPFMPADLGTGKAIFPFPQEGISALKALVTANIYELQGKKDLIFPQAAEGLRRLSKWEANLMTDSLQDVKSGVPPYLRRKIINRRNGYVV